ncbi:peptidase domain-containing ABC transporter [Hyphomicrobium album]|uniref:peptidase domain-containing ABC transporter n=1 Tax=Hyphomicrobium album TaxID=2665159 RepID=UPI0018AAFD95|nr:ATP-binding cassette domain-containing protein [Hyphomicrobium album]
MQPTISTFDSATPRTSPASDGPSGAPSGGVSAVAGREYLQLFGRTFSSLPADVIAASVAINLLGLALPLAILQVYDRIIPRASWSTLFYLVLCVCIVVLLEAVLRVMRSQVIAWAAMKEAWRNSVDAAARVALAPARVLHREPATWLLQRFQAIGTVSDFQLNPARLVIIDLPFVLIFVAFLFAISPLLAAIPFAMFVLFAIVAIMQGRALKVATAARARSEAKTRDFLHETLSGIVDVKALAMEQQVLRRFERLEEAASGHSYNVHLLSDNAVSLASLASTTTQLATVTLGALLTINGDITIGALACCTMLSGRVMQPLGRLVSSWNEIHSVIVAEETARPIYELPRNDRPAPAINRALPARVVFEDVSFTHAGKPEPILSDASFCIEPGAIVALTGPNGSGKSTVVRLALGRLRPQSGQVLIDGIPATLAETCLCGNLALVDYHVASIRGTVLNNLTMYDEGNDAERALSMARLIGLEDDIHALPRGYDTRLGEAASEPIPPSLLQRIAIVRALVSQPRLLILDEANLALDYRSDHLLARALLSLKGKVTIIIITNRPSFAAVADRVVAIRGRKFVQLHEKQSMMKSAASSKEVVA